MFSFYLFSPLLTTMRETIIGVKMGCVFLDPPYRRCRIRARSHPDHVQRLRGDLVHVRPSQPMHIKQVLVE